MLKDSSHKIEDLSSLLSLLQSSSHSNDGPMLPREGDRIDMGLLQSFNFSFTNLPSPSNIKEEKSSSSLIWVILFSALIFLSFVSNLSLLLAVISNPRKRTRVHILICCLFFLNLLDYSLLIVEFTLGVSSHFPWGDDTCAVYQFLQQTNPLYYTTLLILLVYYAWRPSGEKISLVWTLLPVFPLVILVSLPTILYAGTAVYPSGARYCVMDLSGVAAWAGLDYTKWQTVTALYYLMYRFILPYFLPLVLLSRPLLCIYKRINGPDDKNCVISLALAVVSSYFVFYSCYSVVVLIRYTVEMTMLDISSRTAWILAVLQSLFTLLATFQHVFRPLLCFVLDIDLRKDLVAKLSCCSRRSDSYLAVTQSDSQRSNSYLAVTQTDSQRSDSYLAVTPSDSPRSDSYLAVTESGSQRSDSYLAVAQSTSGLV